MSGFISIFMRINVQAALSGNTCVARKNAENGPSGAGTLGAEGAVLFDGEAVMKEAAPPVDAIDTVGAGEGDRVLIVDEGNSGRQILGVPDAPVKTLVVGVIDHVEVAGEHIYNHFEGVGA